MILLRSIVFQVFFFILIALYAIAIILSSWFKSDHWPARLSRSWGKASLWGLGAICGLRYQVHGLERLPKEPTIVLAKHQSAWETIAIRALFPVEQAWVLKKELIGLPFFGWALSALDPIAIDRSQGRKAVRQLLVEGQQWLEAGRWVIIFPEGTRVAPGQHRTYGVGGALLAEKTGKTIVPVAHNAGVFWGRRSIRKYPGMIDLVIGAPISTKDRKASDINREVEEWIEGTVATLPSN